MRRPLHPPAWYPDPKDVGRIRRWNGRAWTDDTRPFPDWLRTLRLSPGPPKKVPRASSRLWAASAAMLVMGVIAMAALGAGRGADPDEIDSSAYVARANARCARTEQAVVTPNRAPRDGPAEARRIDALATGWEQMVEDLRALPTVPADAAKVDRWLDAWDQWTMLGRAYADALRSDDDVEAAAVLRRSEAPNATMTRFALVNGMNDCLFRSR